MPSSEGDFKLRGFKARFDCVDDPQPLGAMVDVGILPGPASKSKVTSMLKLDGEGCSGVDVAFLFDKSFRGDDAVLDAKEDRK